MERNHRRIHEWSIANSSIRFPFVEGFFSRLASLTALRQSRRSLSGCTSGRLQSETKEELDALLSSVLRLQGRAFKGEL